MLTNRDGVKGVGVVPGRGGDESVEEQLVGGAQGPVEEEALLAPRAGAHRAQHHAQLTLRWPWGFGDCRRLEGWTGLKTGRGEVLRTVPSALVLYPMPPLQGAVVGNMGVYL